MNIYLISQNENRGYDTYDSAVVAAETEEQARNTSPRAHDAQPMKWDDDDRFSDWASKPENVTVALLGVAESNVSAGVLCASFNAG